MRPACAPSYFDDPVAAQKLYNEATSWIGTPFREYYEQHMEAGRAELRKLGILSDSADSASSLSSLDVKGPGGGIDCIGLDQEIFYRIGATEKWNFQRTPADYQSHQLGEKVLDWLRGKGRSGGSPDIDPQSKRLAELLVELEIPDAVTDSDADTPRDFFKPGDILVMKHGSLFHMPVIIDDDLHFVNALPRLGVIEGTIQDSSYSSHLVAVFRLKPKAK
jgi:cell wall-associated NlpC family hydrolase